MARGFLLLHLGRLKPAARTSGHDGRARPPLRIACRAAKKRRRRPLLAQGRRDTMVVRQFVHRASGLATYTLIRGAPVRRHPAKAEPRASWCAGYRTLGVRPLSCFHAAEATLLSGHPLSRARAVLDPALGVPHALRGRAPLPVLVCSPFFSACPIRLSRGDIQLLDPRRSPL